MIAYHFTSTVHLEVILKEGVLKRTESNLDMYKGHAGPDVVWLLDGPELAGDNHGLAGSAVDKTEIRFEVEADDKWTKPWLSWAKAQKIDPEWRDILIKAGGGQEAAERWLISFAKIPQDRWVAVTNTKTGDTLWTR